MEAKECKKGRVQLCNRGIILQEDETLEVQEEDGQNNSFSHGTGNEPVIEPT
jgi:hypothetical protein